MRNATRFAPTSSATPGTPFLYPDIGTSGSRWRYIYVYIYIYIYIEREIYAHVYVYIYIYI